MIKKFPKLFLLIYSAGTEKPETTVLKAGRFKTNRFYSLQKG
jgi:hypothetical protein